MSEDRPKLLSGGNPQIPKGDGDAPVQRYISAMPGWKSALGRRLDEIVVRNVPDVRKAVKWNNPLYGRDEGWFFSFRCFNQYVKLTFFNGDGLAPKPPVGSKHPKVRYFKIFEDDALDEDQIESWVRQSAALPGEKM